MRATITLRNGRRWRIDSKIIAGRIEHYCEGLDMKYIKPLVIAEKVISGLKEDMSLNELDKLASETVAYMTLTHPDHGILAGRIAMSILRKETKRDFSAVIDDLFKWVNPKTGLHSPIISAKVHEIIMKNAEILNVVIKHERDMEYSFFAFKTLECSYLLRIDGKVVERPQHMLMRVAIGIHGEDINAAIETYNLMSEKYFTHASPTLFNAGTLRPQLSSCFLLTMYGDSVEDIFSTMKDCAIISKYAGGIGLNIHNIPASDKTGFSSGIVPMLRVFNNTARYVNQGGNKRPGALAIYIEPWHAEIFEFLDLKKNTGKEEQRARDLFYALWIPDLFMERVENDENWSLFDPVEAPNLHEVYGDEFRELYIKYENENRARKVVSARDVFSAIIDSQIETGTPYILYKDACNNKSNQKNIGTIKGSNLCTEVIQYSSPDEIAVCNLASLAIPTFIEGTNYNFTKLHDVVKVVTRNLNKVIDINYYPVEKAKKSNLRHRPIGIGVQGLADAFILLRHPFDSPKARELNKQIFETIYHAALEASCELAEQDGYYDTYPGSPVSNGELQYDMWGVTPSKLWDWGALKLKIAKHGVRNSLLVAPMPTASTSQILGFNECIEPYTSNIYCRRVLSGEFQIVNQWLFKDLIALGLWNDETKNIIIADEGSIRNVPGVPDAIKELYKTVWEISQRVIIDMAADRGAFVDQSQSLNIFIANPNAANLTSMSFYAWKRGLKTGTYYLRSRPAVDAIKFTVDMKRLRESRDIDEDENGKNKRVKTIREEGVCYRESGCTACSS